MNGKVVLSFRKNKTKDFAERHFLSMLKLDMLCCRCQQNLRRCGSVDDP